MTDDEILELADKYMDGALNFRSVAIEELLEFARAIAAREREACAEQCEKLKVGFPSYAEIDEYIQECASAIRARAWSDVPDATQWVDELRGDDEWTPADMSYRPNGLSLEEPPNSTTDVVEPEPAITKTENGLVLHVGWDDLPVGTKLYASPPKLPIKTMREMLNVQGRDGNWNYDSYMHGMYNGMEYMLALAENREPKFRDAPKGWLADIEIPYEMQRETE